MIELDRTELPGALRILEGTDGLFRVQRKTRQVKGILWWKRTVETWETVNGMGEVIRHPMQAMIEPVFHKSIESAKWAAKRIVRGRVIHPAFANQATPDEFHEECWYRLRDQLRRSRDGGFREKTTYALVMMDAIEEDVAEVVKKAQVTA